MAAMYADLVKHLKANGCWKETVSVRHGGDRASPQTVGLAMPDAESMTGISNQQVSRWRKKLVDATAGHPHNLRLRFIYYIQRVRRNFRQKTPKPATRISGTQSPLCPIH